MVNAIGYARISLDRTGEGAGVERQSEDIRQLAIARGFNLVDLVVDNDISASGKRTRPGFERVLGAVDNGSVSVVIAWALDRVTRNRRDTVRFIETCQHHDATIALVRGSDLDLSTPAGRLTADILAAVARSEIETKSDRQKRANQQAVEKGLWRGGRRPFGYEPDGVTVRPDEAKAVRDAYSWILAGESLAEIGRRWNGRGFHTPQGRHGTGELVEWGQANISHTLRNPRYCGLRAYKHEIQGKAQWPALVDEETWYAAQAILRDPARRPNRGDKRLLTGVALCGICGVPVWAGGGAPGRGVYRCRASSGHFSRKRQPVDEYVSAVAVARLSRPDAAQVFQRQTAHAQPDLGAVMREMDESRAKLDALAAAFAEGAISMSQLRRASERLRTRIEQADRKMATTDAHLTDVRNVIGADDVQEAWDLLTRDSQRRIIDALMTIRLCPPGRGVRRLDPSTIIITPKGGINE